MQKVSRKTIRNRKKRKQNAKNKRKKKNAFLRRVDDELNQRLDFLLKS